MFDEATLVCRCAVLSVKVLPDSLSALKHFLAEKDPEIALAIHAVLIKSGDPDEVAQFAAEKSNIAVGEFRSRYVNLVRTVKNFLWDAGPLSKRHLWPLVEEVM
jgi:hypothetical protein